jgi:DNA-binding NarL/FixJ family response regulator
MNKKVVLVDDHQLFRAGVKLLLSHIGGYEVIAECSTAYECIQLTAITQADILIIDISLPDITGIELIAKLKEMFCGRSMPSMFVLSMHAQHEFVARAFRAGAVGYLLKESAPEELSDALKVIGTGQRWISPMLQTTVKTNDPESWLGSSNLLSARQEEVLKMLVSGMNTKSIAHELGLSPKTIETYRAQIMEKLDLRDIPALVRYAIRSGLLTV